MPHRNPHSLDARRFARLLYSASLLTVAALALAPAALSAQELAQAASAVAPIPANELDIAPLDGEIRVDGRVDEAAWSRARSVTDFSEFEPGHLTEPPVRTEAFITYDEDHIYVGIIAYDDPSLVRASLRERDNIWGDDVVGVLIDTYGDAAWGVLLIANAYGVQGDMRMSNGGDDDPNFDIIWESDGAVTERGYEVEFAIPFSSLRFVDTDSWTIGFFRNHPRETLRKYAWPDIDTDNPCLLCQFQDIGTLEGIAPGGSLELLPSVVASQSGALRDGDPAAPFQNNDPSASFSLGARMPFADGWSAEATYNPDFSQVESDAAQVDVNTTFALSFPERRPFFQDGAELFDTPIDVVYTRSINDPQFAGKVTGSVGSTSFAWMGAYDENSPIIVPFEEMSGFTQGGESYSNVLRARHAFGASGSHLGALLTDRRLMDGGAGTTASMDGLYRFGSVYSISAQYVLSHTQEPSDTALSGDINGVGFDGHTADFDGERFFGSAAGLAFMRHTRVWSFETYYQDISPSFRADNGFVARNAYRNVGLWTGYTFRPERFGIQEIRPTMNVAHMWNYDGVAKDFWMNPGVYVRLPKQTEMGVNYAHTFSELFNEVRFDNYGRANFWIDSEFSEMVSLGFEVGHGEQIYRPGAPPVMGVGTNVGAWGTIKPLDRLIIEPGVSYQELNNELDDEFYAGWIGRVRTQFQFNRELSLRLVTQYVDFGDAGVSVEPLLMYRLNPFSIFYVGMTDRFSDFGAQTGYVETDRQFFVKLQYLLRT